jgi:hypothetical protein
MSRLFILYAVSLYLVFAGCSKTSGPANGKSIQPNNNLDSMVSMSAIINGHDWQTDSAFGYNVKYSGNDSAISNLNITATQKMNGNATTIQFNITRYSGTGQYPVNPPLNTAAYYVGNTRHFGTSGTIVVTSTANYSLVGTFNFTADSFSVTGKFNVATP